MMTSQRKPIYLLADSQLLFWEIESNRFIQSIRESLQIENLSVTKAAYIGASNGDAPEFFELFASAMDSINIHECKMIRSNFKDDEREFLETADLILLAGGDVAQGWDIIKKNGMDEIIANRYYEGAVLVGISAGAIQLGMGIGEPREESTFLDTSRIVPYYIDVHEEKNSWIHLKSTVENKEQYSKGFGISAGGGMIYHPDLVIEPIRYPLNEFSKTEKSENKVIANILLPPEDS